MEHTSGSIECQPANVMLPLESSECFSLCSFCDRSTVAYAAVIYLSEETPDSEFVVSKTHVSPLKAKTILRLQFLSTLVLIHCQYSRQSEI